MCDHFSVGLFDMSTKGKIASKSLIYRAHYKFSLAIFSGAEGSRWRTRVLTIRKRLAPRACA